MIACHEFHERLQDQLDARRDPAHDAALASHASHCPTCRRTLAAQKLLLSVVHPATHEAARNAAALPRIRSPRRAAWWVALAGLLLLGLTIRWGGWRAVEIAEQSSGPVTAHLERNGLDQPLADRSLEPGLHLAGNRAPREWPIDKSSIAANGAAAIVAPRSDSDLAHSAAVSPPLASRVPAVGPRVVVGLRRMEALTQEVLPSLVAVTRWGQLRYVVTRQVAEHPWFEQVSLPFEPLTRSMTSALDLLWRSFPSSESNPEPDGSIPAPQAELPGESSFVQNVV